MIEHYDIGEWVDQSPEDQREFREAVHTILASIASDAQLKTSMIIKGGILLAIRYHSDRYTKDIDFSTDKKINDIDVDSLHRSLNDSLRLTVETLDYGLECRVQSIKVNPAHIPDATFPSINIKVGYAYKGSPKHKRLLAEASPTTVSIDFSLNEPIPRIEKLEISDGESIYAYTLTDLMAEKLRALLQQVGRKRNRRQDIFDLFMLLGKFPELTSNEKSEIHESLMLKARARNIEPTINSLDNSELRDRAHAEYSTLVDEIDGELPDFDIAFEQVKIFYKSLPW